MSNPNIVVTDSTTGAVVNIGPASVDIITGALTLNPTIAGSFKFNITADIRDSTSGTTRIN